MKVIETSAATEDQVPDAEALIREARQHQRRRWFLVGLAIAILAVTSGALVSTVGGSGTKSPSSAQSFRRASPHEVAQFEAIEAKAEHQTYAATYRYLGKLSRGSDEFARTFFYAQQPNEAGMYPFEASQFLFRTNRGNKNMEFVQTKREDYGCLQMSRGASWRCEGPTHRSIGNAGTIKDAFDIQQRIDSDSPRPNPDHSLVWSGTKNGLTETCLRYAAYSWRPSPMLWCITPAGITTYEVGPNVPSMQLVELSTTVGSAFFRLPAPVRHWQGYSSLWDAFDGW